MLSIGIKLNLFENKDDIQNQHAKDTFFLIYL